MIITNYWKGKMKNKIIAIIISAFLLPVSISLLIGAFMLMANYDWIAYIFIVLICIYAARFIYPIIKKKIDEIDKQMK